MKRLVAAALAAGLILPAGVRAQTPDRSAPKRTAATIAYFSGLQEAAAFTTQEMAQREASGGLDPEALAADAALNAWKICARDAVQRWAELRPGPGTLVDGAFGRCADAERTYRDTLLRVTQDGRLVVDMQLARSMMRTLEETWRSRLIAVALDEELALHHAAPALPGQ